MDKYFLDMALDRQTDRKWIHAQVHTQVSRSVNILVGRNEAFPLRPRITREHPLPPLLSAAVLEAFTDAVRQETTTQSANSGKEEMKRSAG